jgi:hypothetical protein
VKTWREPEPDAGTIDIAVEPDAPDRQPQLNAKLATNNAIFGVPTFHGIRKYVIRVTFAPLQRSGADILLIFVVAAVVPKSDAKFERV